MEGNVWHSKPEPYHLTINNPSNAIGWLAAFDQLCLDGPSYNCPWGPYWSR